MIKVESKVYPLEPGVDIPELVIKSHWNRSELVVIVLDNKEYPVRASDLIAAIENAQNTNRYRY